MKDLSSRLQKAKTDKAELNRLINDYHPFIKKEVAKTPVFQMDYDDRFSIAMLVFMNCVRQYDDNAGAFMPFAAACIRNRLIDEGRKQNRYLSKITPLYSSDDNDRMENPAESAASKQEYEKEQERLALAEEIDLLTADLDEFGIGLKTLSEICPKQKRSRHQCAALAREIVHDPKLKKQFFQTRRIPQSELVKRFNLSERTIEKHRRYIVSLTLILSGDYPGIQAFLPRGGDTE